MKFDQELFRTMLLGQVCLIALCSRTSLLMAPRASFDDDVLRQRADGSLILLLLPESPTNVYGALNRPGPGVASYEGKNRQMRIVEEIKRS